MGTLGASEPGKLRNLRAYRPFRKPRVQKMVLPAAELGRLENHCEGWQEARFTKRGELNSFGHAVGHEMLKGTADVLLTWVVSSKPNFCVSSATAGPASELGVARCTTQQPVMPSSMIDLPISRLSKHSQKGTNVSVQGTVNLS